MNIRLSTWMRIFREGFGRQLKQVFDWLAENADWALEVFYELNPELK